MHTVARAVALAVVLLGVLPAESRAAPGAGRWEEFGDLVVPLAAAEGITLRIVTDVGVVAPAYQAFPRDDDRWIEHFASRAPAANRSFRGLVQASGWGHIAPYVYAAVYHALGRIFTGLSSNPTLADGQPLIPKRALQPGEIRVKLHADCAGFRKAAAATPLHADAGALYDAGQRQVELCLAPEATDILRSLQPMDQGEPERAVAHLEEFANWMVLRLSAHELVHAVQQGTRVDAYRIAFVREGAAMFLAENVRTREEGVVLGASRPAVPPAREAVEACEKAFGPLEPLSALPPEVVGHLRAAIGFLRDRRDFSIAALLDDAAFYGGDVAAHYAVSYAFMRYLHAADGGHVESWRRVATRTASADDLSMLDSDFVRYLASVSATWWERPDAAARARVAAGASTACKRHGLILQAHAAALLMNAYQPASVLGLVFDGDVFWQSDRFFVALDRYGDAARLLSDHDPLRVMVQSRRADAFEQLGNIEAALRGYRAAVSGPHAPEWHVTVRRSDLKLRYYEATRADGTWATPASRQRLFGYIRDFQSPEAFAEFARRCERGAGFEACRAELVEQRYAEVLARMEAALQAARR